VRDSRLVVRATADFFQDLDRQLPTERGPNGEPSTYDFQSFELLRIVELTRPGSRQGTRSVDGAGPRRARRRRAARSSGRGTRGRLGIVGWRRRAASCDGLAGGLVTAWPRGG
jgi:hypothetical protein